MAREKRYEVEYTESALNQLLLIMQNATDDEDASWITYAAEKIEQVISSDPSAGQEHPKVPGTLIYRLPPLIAYYSLREEYIIVIERVEKMRQCWQSKKRRK